MMPPEPRPVIRPPVQAYVVGPYTFREMGGKWSWAFRGEWRESQYDTVEAAMAWASRYGAGLQEREAPARPPLPPPTPR